MEEITKFVSACRPDFRMLVNYGEFPRQISLGGRAVGWQESEVEAWINSRTTTH
ncbi:MAG: AlpA family phage regulatory protein [Alphaproteobacteria bacterium]|nr:AlpA family phage regulatory protein [Alphaproteobacteria bacterium]